MSTNNPLIHLTPEYKENLIEKYASVLATQPNYSETDKITVAQLLENMHKVNIKSPESLCERENIDLAALTINTYNNLLCKNVVGVQPINGPVSFAFALRGVKYKTGEIHTPLQMTYEEVLEKCKQMEKIMPWKVREGKESLIKNMASPDCSFFSPELIEDKIDNLSIETFAKLKCQQYEDSLKSDMPTAKIIMDKTIVESKSHKLFKTLKIDTKDVGKISNEIDRIVFKEIENICEENGNVSVIDEPELSAVDILDNAVQIAINTRRGSGCVLLVPERYVQLFTNIGISEIKTITTIYSDNIDNIILAYKGVVEYDAGVLFCPYILLDVCESLASDLKNDDFDTIMLSRTLTQEYLYRSRFGLTKITKNFPTTKTAAGFYHIFKIKENKEIRKNYMKSLSQ